MKEFDGENQAHEQPLPDARASKQSTEPSNLLDTSSSGPGSDWPSFLKVLLAMLREFQTYSDSDVLYPLVKAINLLCLNGEALRQATAKWNCFVDSALRNYIVPRLFFFIYRSLISIASNFI